MEDRKSYWYSIIKYIADFTKGEPLNVGIFLMSEENKTAKYILIDDNNLKLKSIFENDLQKISYKYGKDYFEYLISQISDGTYPTENNLNSSNLLSYLFKSNELPKGFLFSEPQFAKSSNEESLFYTLQTSYIGAKFLNISSLPRELMIKERVNDIFTKADLINNKIKSNVRINPSPTLPFKYQIDFAYRVDDQVSLIHAAPANSDLLPSWLEKINLISTKYDKAGKISLMFDSSVEKELLQNTQSVINVLKSDDEKISAVDINKEKYLKKFISDINSQASTVKSLEDLIAI